MKKCKTCKAEFIQYSTIQNLCVECLIIKGRKIAVKNAKVAVKTKRKELANEKEKIKTRRDHIKEVQTACNSYIRARDKGKPCISCDRPTRQGDHAGHWKPTSTSPELRFHEDNIHLQCVQCNLHLHGNVANYRIGLIRRVGLSKVEWLERKHEPAKWTINDLKSIKAEYKAKLKEILNNTCI